MSSANATQLSSAYFDLLSDVRDAVEAVQNPHTVNASRSAKPLSLSAREHPTVVA